MLGDRGVDQVGSVSMQGGESAFLVSGGAPAVTGDSGRDDGRKLSRNALIGYLCPVSRFKLRL
jgi:hypothetical protein